MNKVFLLSLGCLCSTFLGLSAQSNVEETDTLRLIKLQEVQVVASRAKNKTPMSYSNVDKNAIKKANYGQDIPFLLTLTPSVVATSEAGTGLGYTGFRVRGTDANRINITTNGVPLNDSESQSVFWVNMPEFASSIEDLQVQRGVGTSTNGSGSFGASINMKTTNISSNGYGEVQLGGGSFGTFRRTVKVGSGLINDHWAFDGRFSKVNSDGYIDRSGIRQWSYFGQLSYLHDNTVLKLVTFGGEEHTNIAWNGIAPEDIETYGRKYNSAGYIGKDAQGNPLYYRDQTDNYDQRHYQAILTHRFSQNATLNVTAHYTRGLGYTNEYRTSRKLLEYALQPYKDETGKKIKKVDLIRQKHLDNHFGGIIATLSFNHKKFNDIIGISGNTYDGDHFGYIDYIKAYPFPFTPGFKYYDNTGKKKELSAFYKTYYNVSPNFTIYGDLQVRHINYTIKGVNDEYDKKRAGMQLLDLDKSFTFFNPKAGLHYKLNRFNEFYGSVSVANREPNRKNYTDAGINDRPTSERLIDYELGYNFKSPVFSFGTNLYYMNYKDQLVLNGKKSDVGADLTVNVPKSYRMGAEFSISVAPIEQLRWDANLTWSKNRIKDYTQYAEVYGPEETTIQQDFFGDTPIAFSPDLIANSSLSYHTKGFDASWILSYVGKQYLDNTGSELRQLDDYLLNNLRLSYNFGFSCLKDINLGVTIYNLFDKEYSSNGGSGYYYYVGEDGGSPKMGSYTWLYPQAGRHVLCNLTLRF